MMIAEEKIINAAMEAFQLMGVKNVTMDYIAQSAGVSKRTVYELFKDKDALAVATIKSIIVNNNKQMIEIIGATANVIEALFRVLESENLRRHTLSPIFMHDVHRYFEPVSASLYKNPEQLADSSASYIFLKKGMEEGIFRKDLKIEIVDTFLHEVIGILHTGQRIKMLKPEKDDVLNNIMLPYFRGICTKKGIQLMEQYFENLKE